MKKKYLYFVLFIGFLIFLDQLTKQIVDIRMTVGQRIPIIDGVFAITSHRNLGAAFGLFQGQRTFFIIITIIAMVIFIYLAKSINFKDKKFYTISVGFLIAGTLGNFIDRMLNADYGVIDFLSFELINFPIFNIADILLTVGVAMLVIYVFFLEGKQNEQA
ncbi:MAG: signal peptidase II [Erysipelotrichales bacterium]|nr:signal peptidase II [Erysipelotrichales bacterium]